MSENPVSGGPVSYEFHADLAAASRILAAQGVVDSAGHVSHRHPDAPERFFMSRAMAPALVTPDDILEFDLDCVTCNDDGRAGSIERFIHGEIYKARPDVQSVVHSHSPSVIPFGLVETKMQAMFHMAGFLAGGVPVFDIREKFGTTDILVSDPDKGVAFAECLGDKNVALMRAHGSTACGVTLQDAVFHAVYTEVNARVQHWTVALAAGGPMAVPDEEEGRLADAVNKGARFRAWDLWRRQVRDEAGW
ncbi:MAG TPA: class II aldolase/adducin family protein [Alphaproteobacteria bacterium]|nr:class II aldolase/adducin family protein [Alphaproteobacteria bacterium]